MNFAGAAILLGMIAVVCAVLWALVSRRRSLVVGVFTAFVALLAALGAWYAWAESRSIPWTVGYGLVVVIGVASAIRQCTGSSPGQDR